MFKVYRNKFYQGSNILPCLHKQYRPKYLRTCLQTRVRAPTEYSRKCRSFTHNAAWINKVASTYIESEVYHLFVQNFALMRSCVLTPSYLTDLYPVTSNVNRPKILKFLSQRG
jgi:hypothetical protein